MRRLSSRLPLKDSGINSRRDLAFSMVYKISPKVYPAFYLNARPPPPIASYCGGLVASATEDGTPGVEKTYRGSTSLT